MGHEKYESDSIPIEINDKNYYSLQQPQDPA